MFMINVLDLAQNLLGIFLIPFPSQKTLPSINHIFVKLTNDIKLVSCIDLSNSIQINNIKRSFRLSCFKNRIY